MKTDAGNIEVGKYYRIKYKCRDIGYGAEEGELVGTWTGETDYVGKLTIQPADPRLETHYFFADEFVELEEIQSAEETETTINTQCFGIVVTLGPADKEGVPSGRIVSDLHEEFTPADPDMPDEEGRRNVEAYNAAIDGIESLILAHAVGGIDITTPAYIFGIETAVQACMNNL